MTRRVAKNFQFALQFAAQDLDSIIWQWTRVFRAFCEIERELWQPIIEECSFAAENKVEQKKLPAKQINLGTSCVCSK